MHDPPPQIKVLGSATSLTMSHAAWFTSADCGHNVVHVHVFVSKNNYTRLEPETVGIQAPVTMALSACSTACHSTVRLGASLNSGMTVWTVGWH